MNELYQIEKPLRQDLIEALAQGPKTRGELVSETGYARTTIYDELKKMIEENEAKKYPLYTKNRTRGRPKVLFELVDYSKVDLK